MHQRTSRSLALPVVLAAAIAAAIPVHAADRVVPSQYPTISIAIAASQSGDRILVAPGTYFESLSVSGKNLTIEGLPDGAGALPVLDGAGQARLLSVSDGQFAVRRIHFRNGNATNMSPRNGGAILAAGSGTITVDRCRFENCIASTSSTLQGGGGAVFSSMPSATVTGSIFRANRAFRGASLFGISEIIGCQFEGLLPSTGGEIFVTGGGPIRVRDSFLSDSVLYLVNTDAYISGLWRCGASPIYFEVGGQLFDGGGNVEVADCDCDGNGEPDARLLAAGSGDARGNGILDACECLPDLFVDGVVNGADLSALLSQWGPRTGSDASQRCDINWDGTINGVDLSFLLSRWGPCPP